MLSCNLKLAQMSSSIKVPRGGPPPAARPRSAPGARRGASPLRGGLGRAGGRPRAPWRGHEAAPGRPLRRAPRQRSRWVPAPRHPRVDGLPRTRGAAATAPPAGPRVGARLELLRGFVPSERQEHLRRPNRVGHERSRYL